MNSEKPTNRAGASELPQELYATLAEALTHDDPVVRESAVKEFAQRKEKRAVGLLVELLTDDAAGVRFAAAGALTELGWRPANALLQARHAVALHKFQVAATLGDVAVEPLAALLSDEDSSLRMAAVETLSQIGGPKIGAPLCAVLQDENWHLRAVVVQALTRLADPNTVEALTRLARDPSYEVRSVTLDALEAIHAPQCVTALARFLKDEADDLRLRAAELLGQCGNGKDISILIPAAVDRSPAVRRAAVESLKQLDPAWEKTEYARQSTSGLLDALKHEEADVREAAADILRIIGQTPAMNTFLTADLGSVPKNAVTVLAQGLQSSNRDLRQACAEGLGRIGDYSGIALLVPMLKDPDQYVRDAALYALNLLHWKPANDSELVLRAIVLQQWDKALLFENLALEPLVMMLESEDPAVCKGAVETLGKIGNKRAEPALAVMLGHSHKSVRVAAASALRLMGWQPEDPQLFAVMAIELGDWETVKMQGEIAVTPLIKQIKENYHDQEFAPGALAALAEISDPRAVRTLLAYTRDGQIAETVMLALENIVTQAAAGIDTTDLQTLASLNNLVQFRYSFDPKYGSHVRSGLQEVDSSRLKKMAGQELARRS